MECYSVNPVRTKVSPHVKANTQKQGSLRPYVDLQLVISYTELKTNCLCSFIPLKMTHLWDSCGSRGRASTDHRVGSSIPSSSCSSVEVYLGKTLNPKLLMMVRAAPCMVAQSHQCASVFVNGWIRGKNCEVFWINALHKCSHLPSNQLGNNS